jgi:adenylate kinase
LGKTNLGSFNFDADRGCFVVRLVILGGSGSGSGTQARRLCDRFETPLISTGKVLREATACSSESSRHVQPYIKQGEPVPDEMMIEFVLERLKKPDIGKGWIISGYPCTAFQAEQLDFLLDGLGQKLDWAIYLQVSEAVMVNRSLRLTLSDERLEIVHRRIELFYDRTIPILEYYDRRRRLLTINGDQTPDLVQQSIISLLDT